ncbi:MULTISPECIES: hypothetical protein [unclassified Vibrio]|uniref:Uncharacterized protein n=1 Tax=Vibrio sp. HB236076 TaxID=3232307 RepID=A0AB39HLA9_9VIBR|nr:hypothetical protein [Vibrio sp. HB161653]MDP5252942.1 hypothetical protein [Vibrio sp. HB161653]
MLSRIKTERSLADGATWVPLNAIVYWVIGLLGYWLRKRPRATYHHCIDGSQDKVSEWFLEAWSALLGRADNVHQSGLISQNDDERFTKSRYGIHLDHEYTERKADEKTYNFVWSHLIGIGRARDGD